MNNDDPFAMHSRWIQRETMDIQTNNCIDDDDNDRMPDNHSGILFQDTSMTPEHRLGLVQLRASPVRFSLIAHTWYGLIKHKNQT